MRIELTLNIIKLRNSCLIDRNAIKTASWWIYSNIKRAMISAEFLICIEEAQNDPNAKWQELESYKNTSIKRSYVVTT